MLTKRDFPEYKVKKYNRENTQKEILISKQWAGNEPSNRFIGIWRICCGNKIDLFLLSNHQGSEGPRVQRFLKPNPFRGRGVRCECLPMQNWRRTPPRCMPRCTHDLPNPYSNSKSEKNKFRTIPQMQSGGSPAAGRCPGDVCGWDLFLLNWIAHNCDEGTK